MKRSIRYRLFLLAISPILFGTWTSIPERAGAAADAKGEVIVTPVSGLVTTESGGTATFTLALSQSPLSPVKLGINSSDLTEGTVSTTSVTFSPVNWNIPQTITVTGVDDPIVDGDILYTIVLGQTLSADLSFNQVDPPDVSVTNWDNEGGPVANDDLAVTNEEQAVTTNILANDTALNQPPFQVTLVNLPSHGTTSINSDNSATYTPASGFAGTDSYGYKLCDARLRCSTASVAVTVKPVNHPPLAADDAYNLDQDTTLTVPAPGVLENDSDPESAPINTILSANPTHGTLSLNADGSFTYTPTAGFVGMDIFNYQASDGELKSNVAKVTISVRDAVSPAVDWASPSVDQQVFLVGKEVIQLQVSASDNVGVSRVQIYRWDAVHSQYVDIANLTSSPFTVELDTSVLNPGWNQIFARSYDSAGNISERKYIWLYQSIRIFLPLILTK